MGFIESCPCSDCLAPANQNVTSETHHLPVLQQNKQPLEKSPTEPKRYRVIDLDVITVRREQSFRYHQLFVEKTKEEKELKLTIRWKKALKQQNEF